MDDIIVKFIPGKTWKDTTTWQLEKEFKLLDVKIPKGYVTDGASIPRLFRGIFSPTGRYFGAAILHDYVLGQERDWPKSNDMFERALIESDIRKWRRKLIVGAVRLNYRILKLLGKEHEYYD
jgi:hypothetical protein